MQYALTTHRAAVSLVYRLHGIGDGKVIFAVDGAAARQAGWLALLASAKLAGSRDTRAREPTCLMLDVVCVCVSNANSG
jgi:hypothetical protein